MPGPGISDAFLMDAPPRKTVFGADVGRLGATAGLLGPAGESSPISRPCENGCGFSGEGLRNRILGLGFRGLGISGEGLRNRTLGLGMRDEG
jgi:hypothetical protein